MNNLDRITLVAVLTACLVEITAIMNTLLEVL